MPTEKGANLERPEFLQNETPERAMRFNKGKPKLIYGVAVNDAGYKVDDLVDGKRITCHYYNTWKNMLSRCYGKSNTKSYARCAVAEEWLTFSTFRKWMERQDYEGKCLDKDLIVHNN